MNTFFQRHIGESRVSLGTEKINFWIFNIRIVVWLLLHKIGKKVSFGCFLSVQDDLFSWPKIYRFTSLGLTLCVDNFLE